MTQITAKKAASAGGLAVGLHAALKDKGGIWFGWSGDIAESGAEKPRLQRSGNVTYALVDLGREEYEGYYEGFANRSLWPLFHYRVDLASFEHDWYDAYRAVNRRFARLLMPLLKPDDTVWVHDYHLIPLGRELRRLGFEGAVGFFLHIPFPASEIFVSLPWDHELGQDLFAYDLVGFQTPTDLRQFQDYVRHEWGGEIEDDGTIRVQGRRFKAGAYPIGIDVDDFVAMGRTLEAQRGAERLRRALLNGNRKLIIGVDRLDYSKGILERLRAFGQLLDDFPEHEKGVTFIQISAPSRENVQEYQDLRHQVETLSGHINGIHSEADWVPLHYINRNHPRRTLAGFFHFSQIGLVTPLRDGMNLVAEEYVAAQNPDDPGVLVLSRFAGAAPLLADGALIVNPHDTRSTALALHQGLTMPQAERKERWRSMFAAIKANDIASWRMKFLSDLQKGQISTSEAVMT